MLMHRIQLEFSVLKQNTPAQDISDLTSLISYSNSQCYKNIYLDCIYMKQQLYEPQKILQIEKKKC